MVAAIAVWLLREILNSRRIQGILGWIPLAFMLTAREGSRMVLHPDNPVATSPLSIKLTFFLMFGLAILLSVWFIWVQRQSLKSEKMQV